MTGFFAPPELFTALGMTISGDEDLPDGEHLRLLPSPLLGFPIAPFGIFRVRPTQLILEGILWRDRYGVIQESGDLDRADGCLTATWKTEEGVDIAVGVDDEVGLRGTISLLDPVGDRVIAQTSREPFVVAGPRVNHVRIEGRARDSLSFLWVWRLSPMWSTRRSLGVTP